MMTFLDHCGSNKNKTDEVLKAAVGLVGDLSQTFGKRLQQYLRHPVIMQLLAEGQAEGEVEETAKWAREMVNAALV